jgi:hypothetical protein
MKARTDYLQGEQFAVHFLSLVALVLYSTSRGGDVSIEREFATHILSLCRRTTIHLTQVTKSCKILLLQVKVD